MSDGALNCPGVRAPERAIRNISSLSPERFSTIGSPSVFDSDPRLGAGILHNHAQTSGSPLNGATPSSPSDASLIYQIINRHLIGRRRAEQSIHAKNSVTTDIDLDIAGEVDPSMRPPNSFGWRRPPRNQSGIRRMPAMTKSAV